VVIAVTSISSTPGTAMAWVISRWDETVVPPSVLANCCGFDQSNVTGEFSDNCPLPSHVVPSRVAIAAHFERGTGRMISAVPVSGPLTISRLAEPESTSQRTGEPFIPAVSPRSGRILASRAETAAEAVNPTGQRQWLSQL